MQKQTVWHNELQSENSVDQHPVIARSRRTVSQEFEKPDDRQQEVCLSPQACQQSAIRTIGDRGEATD